MQNEDTLLFLLAATQEIRSSAGSLMLSSVSKPHVMHAMKVRLNTDSVTIRSQHGSVRVLCTRVSVR